MNEICPRLVRGPAPGDGTMHMWFFLLANRVPTTCVFSFVLPRQSGQGTFHPHLLLLVTLEIDIHRTQTS